MSNGLTKQLAQQNFVAQLTTHLGCYAVRDMPQEERTTRWTAYLADKAQKGIISQLQAASWEKTDPFA